MTEINIQIKREKYLETYTGMQAAKKTDLLIKKQVEDDKKKIATDTGLKKTEREAESQKLKRAETDIIRDLPKQIDALKHDNEGKTACIVAEKTRKDKATAELKALQIQKIQFDKTNKKLETEIVSLDKNKKHVVPTANWKEYQTEFEKVMHRQNIKLPTIPGGDGRSASPTASGMLKPSAPSA